MVVCSVFGQHCKGHKAGTMHDQTRQSIKHVHVKHLSSRAKLICLLRLYRKVYTFSSQPVCIFGLCLCTYFLLACDWPVELFTMGGQVCACICMLQLDRLILLPCWYWFVPFQDPNVPSIWAVSTPKSTDLYITACVPICSWHNAAHNQALHSAHSYLLVVGERRREEMTVKPLLSAAVI